MNNNIYLVISVNYGCYESDKDETIIDMIATEKKSVIDYLEKLSKTSRQEYKILEIPTAHLNKVKNISLSFDYVCAESGEIFYNKNKIQDSKKINKPKK